METLEQVLRVGIISHPQGYLEIYGNFSCHKDREEGVSVCVVSSGTWGFGMVKLPVTYGQ